VRQRGLFHHGLPVCFAGIGEQTGNWSGQTTADGRFTLLPVCCLGNCDKGPTLMIDDDTHGLRLREAITLADLERLLEHYP
jgi:NADH:ubiquinone oxidoreductase subunit E